MPRRDSFVAGPKMTLWIQRPDEAGLVSFFGKSSPLIGLATREFNDLTETGPDRTFEMNATPFCTVLLLCVSDNQIAISRLIYSLRARCGT